MFTLVTGGVHSGRSNYALRRASELGSPPWVYTAHGGDTDEAVRRRIAQHRRDVEAIWRTATMTSALADLLAPSVLEGCGAAVIDGMGPWIEQRIDAGAGGAPAASDRQVLDEVTAFADRLYRSSVPVVLVTTEVGWGFTPPEERPQRFLRVMTSANQILTEQAGAVVLMVSGVPLKVR